MAATLDRLIAVIEHLSQHPEGCALADVARAANLPPSAAHRLLADLGRHGLVRQVRAQGDYALTLRLAAMGLAFLARSGVDDLARPVLDRLAAETGELVRLAVADGPGPVWVAVAQGARSGLRYDPGAEQGVRVPLAASATGRAWLSTLPEDRALALAVGQGLSVAGAVPVALADLAAALAQARSDGHAVAVDTFLPGMAAMAAPVRAPDGAVLGCLSVAGPSVRLTADRMAMLAGSIKAAAAEIGALAQASPLFRTLEP